MSVSPVDQTKSAHVGLVGGGRRWPRPGEISLAHRGVLFLDELPEFSQPVLEVMRQPLEDKVVTISLAQGSLTFPANFMLIAAANPCPCGTCSPSTVTRYQKRVSGPLLDPLRVDTLRDIEVPRVDYNKLTDDRLGEPSEAVRARVEAARERQRALFTGMDIAANADMRPADVRKYCKIDDTAMSLVRSAMAQLQLSARAFHRILKLAPFGDCGFSGERRDAAGAGGGGDPPSVDRGGWGKNRAETSASAIENHDNAG